MCGDVCGDVCGHDYVGRAPVEVLLTIKILFLFFSPELFSGNHTDVSDTRIFVVVLCVMYFLCLFGECDDNRVHNNTDGYRVMLLNILFFTFFETESS